MVANGAGDPVKGPQSSCSPLGVDNINPKVTNAQYAVRCAPCSKVPIPCCICVYTLELLALSLEWLFTRVI